VKSTGAKPALSSLGTRENIDFDCHFRSDFFRLALSLVKMGVDRKTLAKYKSEK
jgi:hypothetical protein